MKDKNKANEHLHSRVLPKIEAGHSGQFYQPGDATGSAFYGLAYRLKYTGRWSLMHNLFQENVMEHSYTVAVISLGLAVMWNKNHRSRGVHEHAGYMQDTAYENQLDLKLVLTSALFHDLAESITGDVPTPVKHYNTEVRETLRIVEDAANQKLGSSICEAAMAKEFEDAIKTMDVRSTTNRTVRSIVKAADAISAAIKCIEELRGGNEEFRDAYEDTERQLKEISKDIPEVREFCAKYLDHVGLSRKALGALLIDE